MCRFIPSYQEVNYFCKKAASYMFDRALNINHGYLTHTCHDYQEAHQKIVNIIAWINYFASG